MIFWISKQTPFNLNRDDDVQEAAFVGFNVKWNDDVVVVPGALSIIYRFGHTFL